MSIPTKSLKIAAITLLAGIGLSLASAAFEIRAQLKPGHSVAEVGSQQPATVRQSSDYYLSNSMAIRLFAVGAVLIVVGTVQIQRANLNSRMERLEKELEFYRRQSPPVTA